MPDEKLSTTDIIILSAFAVTWVWLLLEGLTRAEGM